MKKWKREHHYLVMRDANEGSANKASGLSGFYFCCVFVCVCLVFVRSCNNKQQWFSIVESWHRNAFIYPDNPASLCPRLSDSSLWSFFWLCLCVCGWVCLWKCPLAGLSPHPRQRGRGLNVYVSRLHKLQRVELQCHCAENPDKRLHS